jgi:hypothetical protein
VRRAGAFLRGTVNIRAARSSITEESRNGARVDVRVARRFRVSFAVSAFLPAFFYRRCR